MFKVNQCTQFTDTILIYLYMCVILVSVKNFRIKTCLNQCSQCQWNVHHVNSKKRETTAINGSVCKKVDLQISTYL